MRIAVLGVGLIGGSIGLSAYSDGTFISFNGGQQISGTWVRVS